MNGSLFAFPVGEFLDRLAADNPTPGGGSAAALAGATGAALLEMAARVSTHRKGSDVGSLTTHADAAAQLRVRLLRSMDADAAAYDGVAQALRLPKDSEAASLARQEALERALRHAAEVPLDTATAGLEALEVAEVLLPLCGKQLASDLAVGVRLTLAGIQGALDNVDANALAMSNAEIRNSLATKRARVAEEAQSRSRNLLSATTVTLSAWRSDASA